MALDEISDLRTAAAHLTHLDVPIIDIQKSARKGGQCAVLSTIYPTANPSGGSLFSVHPSTPRNTEYCTWICGVATWTV